MIKHERPLVHRSIFAKVVTSMLAMGGAIVVLVFSYFAIVVYPDVHNQGGMLRHLHNTLIMLLVLLIIGVVFTTYVALQRALRPLRTLQEGVAQLGEGRFDVVLPVRTRDEFALLTTAFNEMVQRVRNMIQARDQLLLDVSHELRSPLTRLKVALALLPEADQRGMAADIAEMEIMIGELLELERLRDGRGIQPERQNLVAVVRDVVESFRHRDPGVVFTPARDEMFADIDAERVRVVVRNLLENAIKYSMPDSRPVEISAAETSDAVTIRVRDNGPGIPEAERDSLFEPFVRIDRSRSRKTGGYGLGLSICKRIMEAHRGSIAIEESPGRGATFVVTFPRSG